MAIPGIIKVAHLATLAYKHRDKAAALHEKYKGWKKGRDDDASKEGRQNESEEERIGRLEVSVQQMQELTEEQTAFMAELFKDLGVLATASKDLHKRMTLLMILCGVACCCAVVALIFSLR